MAIAERLISMIAQWAKGAQTIIPNPPVPGIAYRNETVTPSDMESGQSYDKVYDSARYNQRDYLVTGLVQMAEQYGIMPYSGLTNYPAGGFCLGTDGILYQAAQPSGPDNGGARPTTNTSFWNKRDFAAMVQGTRKVNTTAPLEGGGALTGDLTLSLKSSSAATAGTVIIRDAAGRAQIAAPAAAADIARKDTVDNAFAGAAKKSHASADTSYGRGTATAYGHVAASSAAPLVAGTAAVGTDNGKYAREGHVHPAQTSVSGNAGSATKLATPRNVRVRLDNNDAVPFDGTAALTPGVVGTLPVANGGTGATSIAGIIQTLYSVAGAISNPMYLLGFDTSGGNSGFITPQKLRNAMGLGNTLGALPIANGGTGNATGNAASATKLATARGFRVSGGATMDAAVTFDGTGPCSLPITGLNASYINSGTVPSIARLGMAQSAKVNGYVKLPGGVIIQWGNPTSTTAGTVVTFPLAFPTRCNMVVCSDIEATYGASYAPRTYCAGEVTTTQFKVMTSAAAGGAFSWVAVGS